ncbi:nickel-dependent hydrogenase large subunit [Rhizobium beringeri]
MPACRIFPAASRRQEPMPGPRPPASRRRPIWRGACRPGIGDVRISLTQLTALARTGDFDCASLACSGPTPGAGGYGAVECARGRLYHQIEIGGDGRLAAYRILAPTEWNFHPAGPFVETLLSSPVGADEAAVRSISRLAVLFDPCVAFEINVREAADA